MQQEHPITRITQEYIMNLFFTFLIDFGYPENSAIPLSYCVVPTYNYSIGHILYRLHENPS